MAEGLRVQPRALVEGPAQASRAAGRASRMQETEWHCLAHFLGVIATFGGLHGEAAGIVTFAIHLRRGSRRSVRCLRGHLSPRHPRVCDVAFRTLVRDPGRHGKVAAGPASRPQGGGRLGALTRSLRWGRGGRGGLGAGRLLGLLTPRGVSRGLGCRRRSGHLWGALVCIASLL